MANYKATDTEFQSVANAIRTKGGTSSQLVWPDGFVSAISAISTGCPRVEQEMIFQQATFLTNTMSWTVTAVEET